MKYLENGAMVRFSQKLENGSFLVYPVYDVGDELCEDCECIEPHEFPMVVNKIYDEPPKQKMLSGIQHLEDRFSDLTFQIKGMQERMRELRALEFNAKKQAVDAVEAKDEKFKELSKFKGLEFLQDFVEGRITHIISKGYHCYGVHKLKDYLLIESEDRYDADKLKLLSLYGCSEGDLSWNINECYTGHGNSTQIIPFKSEKEAVEKALELNTEFVNRENHTPSEYVLKEFRKVNAPLPEGYAEKVEKIKKKDKEKEIEELQKKIRKLR